MVQKSLTTTILYCTRQPQPQTENCGREQLTIIVNMMCLKEMQQMYAMGCLSLRFLIYMFPINYSRPCFQISHFPARYRVAMLADRISLHAPYQRHRPSHSIRNERNPKNRHRTKPFAFVIALMNFALCYIKLIDFWSFRQPNSARSTGCTGCW